MIYKLFKHINLLLLTVVLPCVYGCGSGGGDTAALTSFLFDGNGGDIGLLQSTGGSLPLEMASVTNDAVVSSVQLATTHNPEPATMLLLGGGIVAMTYLNSVKNRGSKK